MAIIKTRKTSEYTQIHNGAAQDPELSAKAKGVLLYIMSLPDDWTLYKTELHNHFKDGRDAIKKGFDELIEHGYAMQREIRNEKGHFVFEYMVSDKKFTVDEIAEYTTVSPVTEKPLRKNRNGKPVTTKEIQQKKQYKKNTSKYVGTSSANPVFDFYKENYELTGYAKKKLTEMVEQFGEEITTEAIKRAVLGEAKKPIAYVSATLRKWIAGGVKTIEDINRYEETHKKKKSIPSLKKSDRLPTVVEQQLKGLGKKQAQLLHLINQK